MRVLKPRWIACGIATSVALSSCGVLVGLGSDDPVIPDRGDLDGAGAGDAPFTSPDGTKVGPNIDDAGADACTTLGTCAPQLVTKVGAEITRLVVQSGALYVASSVNGAQHVFRVANAPPGLSLDLDPQAVFADQFRRNGNIVVDASGAVYWGTPNGLRRHEAGAGADASSDAGVTSLSELGAPVSGVRIFGGRLAFAVDGANLGATANSGHLASCALPGCSDVQFTAVAPLATDLMVSGLAYVWFGADTGLVNYGLRKSGNILVGGEQHQPSRMVSDGADHVYWSAVEGLRGFSFSMSNISELLAAPTTLANRVNGVAIDNDGTLYLTQGAALLRCSVSTGACAPKAIASGPGTAVDVALDATYAYWGTNEGSILRVRIH